MRAGSLVAAFSVVAIANAVALVHVARNRWGAPDAEVTLTQRELRFVNAAAGDENSGVTLNLQWVGPGQYLPFTPGNDLNWLDTPKLRQLGFDCSVDPASPDAPRFYQRQQPRRAFAAFEYDGPAWEKWFDAYQKAQRYTPAAAYQSHLVAIDADVDPATLRARHPDRVRVVILPAVVAINLMNYPYSGSGAGTAPLLHGYLSEVPATIHLPLPFSAEFRGRSRSPGADYALSYNVRLRFGSAFEPEVIGVEFTQSR